MHDSVHLSLTQEARGIEFVTEDMEYLQGARQ